MNVKRYPLSVIGLIVVLFLFAACAGEAGPGTVTEVQVVTETIVLENDVAEMTSEETGMEAPAEHAPLVQATPMPAPTQAVVQPAATPVPTQAPQPTASPASAETADSMYFEEYGVNPYTATSEDHLSTFAMDVDTGSYTIMRRYLNGGSLPPSEAVRVEEFVNYFEQAYPSATDAAFAIYADGAPSPFLEDGSHILRIGVQGYDVPDAQRLPVALAFVIDSSGSMERENRLGLVKQSLALLVNQLRPDDQVAIIEYGSQARVVLEPTTDKEAMMRAINGLRAGGSTNAEAGLLLGYQMADRAFRSDGINRVILLSDGVANTGATDPNVILNEIRQEAEGGITLTTVGVGMGNYSDAFMEQLADNGQGQYAYVDTVAEAEDLFVNDLTGTLQVIALDAKAQVDFNPDVVAQYRLLGYENRAVADSDFRDNSVDAGEIGAGHSVTALYAVQLHPEADGRIATVQIRWQDPTSYQVAEINSNVNTWELAPTFAAAAPRYQLAVVVGQFAEWLRGSPWAQAAGPAELYGYAAPLAEQLANDADVAEFANLVAQASQVGGVPVERVALTTAVNQVSPPPAAPPASSSVTGSSALAELFDWPKTFFIVWIGLIAVLAMIIYWPNLTGNGKTAVTSKVSTISQSKIVQAAEAQVMRAKAYRRQLINLFAGKEPPMYMEQFRPLTDEFQQWETRLVHLKNRLRHYEGNDVVQQDIAAVPQAIQRLEALLEAEKDPAVRRQIEGTLARYEDQQAQLAALTSTMRRTRLQMEETVATMGTIYSQLQLLEAMDIDNGQARRLSHNIQEEVRRLNDLLAAVEEVTELADPNVDVIWKYAAA